MTEEMPVKIPYALRTLFDEEEVNEDFFGICYCPECFNGYNFKSIEWVKVKSIFCERRHLGRLVEDEEIWHNFEKELIEMLKKYSIPYEAENGIYTIYGYQ